jgi:hypothetical protein
VVGYDGHRSSSNVDKRENVRVKAYFNINGILLVGDQFGFRKNLSTEKATKELTVN